MTARLKYRIRERIRAFYSNLIGYRFACWLDKRLPNWCWAHLCTDIGLGWNIRGWRRAKGEGALCRKECAELGSCWCGKFRKEDSTKAVEV